LKVLLIDDNPEITELFQTTLSSNGHVCQVANDGREGLEQIKKSKSDIVLLDLAIPDFSGEDLLNELLKEGPINGYNIYIFTASAVSDKEENDFIKMGIVGCLRKPVRLNDLLETLEKHKAPN